MEKGKTENLLKIYSIFILSIFVFFGCKNRTENGTENGIEQKETNDWIIGKWKVTNSDFLPFEHISFCENLDINSIFEFSENGNLKVYTSENDKKNCNETQSYRVEKNKIVILEYDMLFEYEIISKSNSELKLRITHFPNSMYDKIKLTETELENVRKNGFKISLSKEK